LKRLTEEVVEELRLGWGILWGGGVKNSRKGGGEETANETKTIMGLTASLGMG